MKKENIESRPVWKPMHMQPFFEEYDYVGSDISEKLYENGVCLPSDTKMTDEDLERIGDIIKSLWRLMRCFCLMKELNLLIKRLIDLFGSVIGSIIISPILIIIAILIKITSKGPVFFKQERLGKDGKIFNILKFRTMVVNAEKIGDRIIC